jgi:ATP-dependent RNA helicase RhlB
MNFSELSLHEALQNSLDKHNYKVMTPIQEQAIPEALRGRDLTGLAQTGTGKTLAFLVPIINQILLTEGSVSHACLILAPTRELVLQISTEAQKLLEGTNLKVATIIGGADYKVQEKELEQDACMIIASPGRLIDFIKTRSLDLTNTQYFVLDEADRMFDMGFIMDIRYVFHKLKNLKQTLLFSATLSYTVMQIASRFLKDPVEVEINPEKIIAENITQKLVHLGRDEKLPYLVNHILNDPIEGLGIIFTNYKSNIQPMVRKLNQYGISACGLSSDLDQRKRVRFLKEYRSGKYKFMIATDVASRGIDVENINIVYNYDLPQDTENYVHRIGRTARAGKKGKSVSFCSESDYNELEKIERFLKQTIEVIQVAEESLSYPQGEFENLNPPEEESKEPRNDRGGNRDRNGRKKRDQHDRSKKGHGPRPQRTERQTPIEGEEATVKADRPARKPHHNKGKDRDRNPAQNKRPNRSNRDFPESLPANKSSIKRNLFDINDPNYQPPKKGLWKKLKSIFGF